MNILIQETECWICGEKTTKQDKANPLTDHHALPKHLRPKNNVIIPICERCHKKLNQVDVKGMFAFAYKIDKTVEDVRVMTKKLFERVSEAIKKK